MSVTLSEQLCETLVEAFYNADGVLSLTDDYSGRGMYGDECFGVGCSNISSFIAFNNSVLFDCDLEEDDIEVYRNMIEDVKSDSLGMGIIFYFPYYKWFNGIDIPEPKEEENGDW